MPRPGQELRNETFVKARDYMLSRVRESGYEIGSAQWLQEAIKVAMRDAYHAGYMEAYERAYERGLDRGRELAQEGR